MRRAVVPVILLGAGGVAYAQVDYRLAAGLVGLASNSSGLPSEDRTGQADLAVGGRGALELGYLGKYTTSRLSYEIMATKWLRNTQASPLTQMLRLTSNIEVSPAIGIGLSAGAMLTQLGLADTVSAASAPNTVSPPTTSQPTSSQQVGPQPSGNPRLLALDLRETLAWQPNSQWRLDQGLTGSEFRFLGRGASSIESKAVTLDLGVARLWQQDSLGLRSRVALMRTSGLVQGDAQPTMTPRQTELAEAALAWGHHWSSALAHELAAGLLVVRSDRVTTMPSGAVSLTWQRSGWTVSGRIAQTADYAAMVGSAYQRRIATLAVGRPLDLLETMRVLASASVERDTLIDAPDGFSRSIDIAYAQAGLGWQPGDTFVFGLTYTFRQQWASAVDEDQAAYSSFRRQMIMLSVGATYGGMF